MSHNVYYVKSEKVITRLKIAATHIRKSIRITASSSFCFARLREFLLFSRDVLDVVPRPLLS